MADGGAIVARLIGGKDDLHALRSELARRRVLVPGDDGRSIVACVLADENCCATP